MALAVWVQGAVVALAAVQFVVFWYLYRQSDIATATSGERSTAGGSESAIFCPDCGASNEPTFRYCQYCVTELPGRTNRTGISENSERSGLS